MKKIIRKMLSKLYSTSKHCYYSEIYKKIGNIGENCNISDECDFQPPNNIYIGNNTSIGARATFWSTNAKIKIGNYVMVGPNVTIITGNHQTNFIGKLMADIKDSEKDNQLDADVIIEDDVWIAANTTILKGVTVKKGCVIAAGSILTKSTPEEYAIYGGVPAKLIKKRFNNNELQLHKNMLNNK